MSLNLFFWMKETTQRSYYAFTETVFKSLFLVVELSGLPPGQSRVLGLDTVVDHVGGDDGRNNEEEGFPDPPESVGDSLGDGSGEGPLLHGRQVVLGGAADGGEGAEAQTASCEGGTHLVSEEEF